MSIGGVLLQPQKIRRSVDLDPEAALVDDFLSLISRLVLDKEQGKQILDVFAEAMEAAAQRMIFQCRNGIGNARTHLQDIIKPLIDSLGTFGNLFSGVDTLGQLTEVIEKLISLLKEYFGEISIDLLRDVISKLLDIVNKDLGFSSTFIQDQVWVLIDDVITRLKNMPPDTDLIGRENRLTVAVILGRVKRHLKGTFTFPSLDADRIAGSLFSYLQRSGIEKVVNKAACVTGGIDSAIKAGSSLAEIVPLSDINFRLGPNSVGAADVVAYPNKQYCWYSTWLLGNKGTDALKNGRIEPYGWYRTWIPIYGGYKDDIWFDKEKKKLLMSQVCGEDVVIGDDIADWSELPVFTRSSGDHYTFKCISKDTMEKLAFGSSVSTNILEMLLHLLSLEEGDYASNVSNAMLNAIFMTYKISKKEPLDWKIEWLFCRSLWTLVASFEGMHTRVSAGNWFMMWFFTLLLPDAGEMLLYKSSSEGARDLLLSVCTLLNYDGPVRHEPFPDDRPDDRPLNRKEVDGVADVFVVIASKLLAMSIAREDYGHPFQPPGERITRMWLLWDLLGGIGFGLMGGFIGTLAAEITAWSEDWSVLGRRMIISSLEVWNPLNFWMSLYNDKEGNTDKGKYNPNGSAFREYPAASSSPYNLPYTSGKSIYVGQGNQGMWSHNFINGSQIYAYDFSMDQDEEILASRPGTVVDFFDWVPNDKNVTTNMPAGTTAASGQTNSTNWNFIVIRHDVDDSGNQISPDPAHDLGPGGQSAVTYAVYGHGRQNSVRQVFADRLGIPLANITPQQILGATVGSGLKVKKGQTIMLAGDTGISFHNHLHMMVQMEQLPRSGGPGAPISNAVRNRAFTIPFVFREVTNFIGPDGVPKFFNYYTSENTRVP